MHRARRAPSSAGRKSTISVATSMCCLTRDIGRQSERSSRKLLTKISMYVLANSMLTFLLLRCL